MKFVYLLFFSLIFNMFTSSAQEAMSSDTISYENRTYLYQGYPFTMKEYEGMLTVLGDEQAKERYQKAKKNSNIGLVATYFGTGFLGYTLASMIFQGELNWINITTASLTVVSFSIAIPSNRSLNKHIESSFDRYNEVVKRQEPQSYIFLAPSNKGFALGVNF